MLEIGELLKLLVRYGPLAVIFVVVIYVIVRILLRSKLTIHVDLDFPQEKHKKN